MRRVELTIGGVSPELEFAWTGIVTPSTPLAVAEPGHASAWRVTMIEEETMEADPADLDAEGPLGRQPRIVYADRLTI